jgi:hypothetical protein
MPASRQPISRGEEVVYDYSTTMWEEHWTMRCQCGESDCRRLVEDFPQLPDSLKQTYLREGIVQEFIRRRLELTPSLKAEGA